MHVKPVLFRVALGGGGRGSIVAMRLFLMLSLLTIFSFAAATASAQVGEGEPNCILIGSFPAPVCNCDTPGPIVHTHGSTSSYQWWSYTGQCNGEGQPCPWEYGGVVSGIPMTIEIPGGWCVKNVVYYWCVDPPGTLALCENGQCPDGPKNYFNKVVSVADPYPCSG